MPWDCTFRSLIRTQSPFTRPDYLARFGWHSQRQRLRHCRSCSSSTSNKAQLVDQQKAAFGELTDSTNEAIAFAVLPLGWSVGAALAPAMGGFLFDKGFKQYPALLPCGIAAAVPLIAFGVCLFGFEETLSKADRKAQSDGQQYLQMSKQNTSLISEKSQKTLPCRQTQARKKVSDTCFLKRTSSSLLATMAPSHSSAWLSPPSFLL